MPINYSTAVKNGRLAKVVETIDAQTASGTFEIYNLNGATVTVLAVETLAKPSATVTNGILTFAGVPITTTVTATGTATHARIKDGAGTIVADGLTVGATGSGANIVVNTTSLVLNQNLTLNSFTITHA